MTSALAQVYTALYWAIKRDRTDGGAGAQTAAAPGLDPLGPSCETALARRGAAAHSEAPTAAAAREGARLPSRLPARCDAKGETV